VDKTVGEVGPYQSRFHKESVATLLRLAWLAAVRLCRTSGVKGIATSSAVNQELLKKLGADVTNQFTKQKNA
jgi:hypothetical protein